MFYQKPYACCYDLLDVGNDTGDESIFHGHPIPTHFTPEEDIASANTWEVNQSTPYLCALNATFFSQHDLHLQPADAGIVYASVLTFQTAWNGLFSLLRAAKDMSYRSRYLPGLICLNLGNLAIRHVSPTPLPTDQQITTFLHKIIELIKLAPETEYKALWEGGQNLYTLYKSLYLKFHGVRFAPLGVAGQLLQ